MLAQVTVASRWYNLHVTIATERSPTVNIGTSLRTNHDVFTGPAMSSQIYKCFWTVVLLAE